MGLGNRVLDVKPPLAASRAGLAVSGVDRWHEPTLILALRGEDDVAIIWQLHDADVIHRNGFECARHALAVSAWPQATTEEAHRHRLV